MLKFQGKVTDTNGNPVASARLTILTENVITPLPLVYSINPDGSIVNASNPLLTDANGEYVFAVESGSYSISVTGSSAVLNVSKTITQFTASSSIPVAPVQLYRSIYAADNTWIAPSNCIQAWITCIGAGGGGGGGTSYMGGTGGGGAGGSGGASVRRTVPVSGGYPYAIVIGIGGGGGVQGVAGVAGGNTTFGTLVQANGGDGGGSSTTSAQGVASAPGNGTLNGIGGGLSPTLVTTPIAIINGFGAAMSGGTGGDGGNGTGGLNGYTGGAIETFPGGDPGLGDATFYGGGGGGGSSAFGSGGKGGNWGGAAAQSPLASDWGAGGGGGAANASGEAGSNGLCIVEWIS